MKSVLVFFSVFAALTAATRIRRDDDKYTTKYDNIDYESIIHSDRLLRNYVNCVVGKGSCTPEGTELKKSLPDALANECAKCSDKQKEASERILKYLIANKVEWYKEVEVIYDKTGEYRKKYLAEAKKRGIDLP